MIDLAQTARKNRAARTAPTLDRLPPHDIEMEKGSIGCCLLDPAAIDDCIRQFREHGKLVFYDLAHQAIYRCLTALREAMKPVELITVQEWLKTENVLEQVGGLAYLSELQDAVPSAANLSYYNDKLLEKFQMRQAIQLCSALVGRIYDYEGNVPALLSECEAEFSKLTEFAAGEPEEKHLRDVILGVINDMEQHHYSQGSTQLRGLPLGKPGDYIDKVVMGVRETHYVTIAARPGDGKSSLAMNIAEHLAKDYEWYEKTGKRILVDAGEGNPQVEVDETVKRKGIPIGIFSIEMDNESLGYRLLFGRAGISEAKYNQGFRGTDDQKKLSTAAAELGSMNIYLDDTPGQSIGRIAAKARRMAKQHGIKLFILDYLQLATTDDPREEERIRLDKISKKIMALKKQLKVPWIVLAQLNRNIEGGRSESDRNRQPLLSDLAGSGSIEQDSDKVIILKKTPRKEVDAQPEDAHGQPSGSSQQEVIDSVCRDWAWDELPSRVDAWVVKNRRGPRGKAELLFQNNLCRFVDFHAWKVANGIEDRKAGESKHALPTAEEMNLQ